MGDGVLTLIAEASDAETLTRVQHVLGSHLESLVEVGGHQLLDPQLSRSHESLHLGHPGIGGSGAAYVVDGSHCGPLPRASARMTSARRMARTRRGGRRGMGPVGRVDGFVRAAVDPRARR